MTDREKLEYAAKAAGVNLVWRTLLIDGKECECSFNMFEDGRIACWEPHINDGDALRLAVQLKMSLKISEKNCSANVNIWTTSVEKLGTDACAATRRAIVRTAAEIGKAME